MRRSAEPPCVSDRPDNVIDLRPRIPFPPSIGEFLLEWMRRWDLEDAQGPHVVVAHGDGSAPVCYGPYPTRELAVRAAASETEAWAREFAQMTVHFDVAPLLGTHLIADELGF